MNDLRDAAVAEPDDLSDGPVAETAVLGGRADRFVSGGTSSSVLGGDAGESLGVVRHGPSVENLTAGRKACRKLDMANTYRMEGTNGEVREVRSSRFQLGCPSGYANVAERFATKIYGAVLVMDTDMTPGGEFIGIYGEPAKHAGWSSCYWDGNNPDQVKIAEWESAQADVLESRGKVIAAHSMRLSAAQRTRPNGTTFAPMTPELEASAARSRADAVALEETHER